MTSADDPKPAATPFAEHRVASVKPKVVKEAVNSAKPAPAGTTAKVPEIGGPPGPEPTRYGDWQFNGKVTDF